MGFLRAGTLLCVPGQLYKPITLPARSSSEKIIFLLLQVAAAFSCSRVVYQRISCQLYPPAKCLVLMINSVYSKIVGTQRCSHQANPALWNMHFLKGKVPKPWQALCCSCCLYVFSYVEEVQQILNR